MTEIDYEARQKQKDRNYDPKTCEWCGTEFKPAREKQKYCNAGCRYRAWFDRTYVKREETR